MDITALETLLNLAYQKRDQSHELDGTYFIAFALVELTKEVQALRLQLQKSEEASKAKLETTGATVIQDHSEGPDRDYDDELAPPPRQRSSQDVT